MTFNVDLHTYGWPTFERGRFELPGISYQGERSLQALVDRCSEVNLDLIGLVNFGDTRFQQVYETAKDLPSGYQVERLIQKREPILVIVHPPNEKPVTVLRGQQVLTQEGHILILGAPKQLPDGKHLEDTVKEARELGCLIIAPTPYFVQGKNVEGTTPGAAEYTAPIPTDELKTRFENCLGFFDAIETFSASPWPRSLMDLFRLKEQNRASAQFGQRYNIPQVAVSEAHALSHLGKAYISFAEQINNGNVIESLRRQIARGNYSYKQNTVSIFGMGRLLAADLWNHFSLKRGWLTIRRE